MNALTSNSSPGLGSPACAPYQADNCASRAGLLTCLHTTSGSGSPATAASTAAHIPRIAEPTSGSAGRMCR
jgi:hypothetical protein